MFSNTNPKLKPQVIFEDLNKISYKTAWDYQTQILKALVTQKREIKKDAPKAHYNRLLFCEHNHVYTLGKSGAEDHLLLNEAELLDEEVEFFKINRGGDITYHGEGQITGYPIFDLDEFYHDLHRYVRELEEVVIRTLKTFGLIGTRIEGMTGVWIKGEGHKPDRKLCAIGVHLSRWVTMHGFALNVNTDLSYFKNIVPCGINQSDKEVTSMRSELGKALDINRVKEVLKSNFKEIFDFDWKT